MFRSRSLLFLLATLSPLCCEAGIVPSPADAAYLATIRDDHPTMPRSFTAEELRMPRPVVPPMWRAPPIGPVRAQAEYEATDSLLVRWGSQNALIAEMAAAVTTMTSDGRMTVVVTGSTQQASATTTLSGAGANLSRIDFVTDTCAIGGCSVWMRDYGPRFVDEAGARGMVDHTYNRPRPGDDAFTDLLSTQWSEPQYDLPLVHGGGNFHLFATRRAFMTELVVNENPGVTPQQIRDDYRDYQGLDLTLVTPFPASFDSTQHIDMWILPVDADEIIVSQYPASVGSPSTIADAFAAARQAEGYTVRRTPGWRSGSTHFTYANAVVMNEIVLVCQFNTTPTGTENAAALATFAAAFEDRTIVPINCSGIIGLAGAIHCIVMHVPRMLADSGTAITATPNPAVTGQTVTLGAQVTSASATPTGAVAFNTGTRVLGSATLAAGTASLPGAQFAVGTHAVVATYDGSATIGSSQSTPLTLVVERGSSTATLGVLPATAVSSQPVTVRVDLAAVAPASGVPGGLVSIFDGATQIAQVSPVNGVATLTRSDWAVGTHVLSAQSATDPGFFGASSGQVVLEVGRASTVAVSRVSPAAPVAGSPVIYSAELAVQAPGQGTPTGSVEFRLDGELIGSATLTGGVASLAATAPAEGVRTLRVVYSGDALRNGSEATVGFVVAGEGVFANGFEAP